MEEPYIYVCSDCGAEAYNTKEGLYTWRHSPYTNNLLCPNYGYPVAVRKKYYPEVVMEKLER